MDALDKPSRPSLGSSAFYTIILIASSYLFYRWLLPKPIPGIPYNKEAGSSLFGDIPSMIKHSTRTQELHDWIVAQNAKLQSPIIQLFVRPFTRPWVVVADYQESRDVMLRRTKEFDRSYYWSEVSGSVMPESHIFKRINDDHFKRQRRWVQGLMTPRFLNDVAASHIYNVCLDFMQLWEQKSRLAQGHPFAAAHDVYYVALDAIWTIVFGPESPSAQTTTRAQVELLSAVKTLPLPQNKDTVMELPRAPCPETLQSVIELAESYESTVKSPWPRISHWILRQTSGTYKRAFKIKENFIEREITKAIKRAQGKSESLDIPTSNIKSAIDDMIDKETALAEKEHRKAEIMSRSFFDEILTILIAAHDTTGTVITWALKILADNPEVQDKLRAELRAVYPEADAEKRYPTVHEINSITSHYRDATIEEIIRFSRTESALARTAMADVELLGHRIPKGTEVFFMGNGPSFFTPEFQIRDSLRSQSYLSGKDKDKSSHWDPKHLDVFDPERWLIDENGQKVFNSTAGPLLTFGLGPRGCSGRKMAYLELKTFITLLIWNFKLCQCPKELSGYGAVDKLVHAPQQCYVTLVKEMV
ncbi:cytochrome P450 [Trichoderma barbatum]